MNKLLLAGLSLMVAMPSFSQTRQINPQDAGLNVLIPDTVAFRKDKDHLSNWEAETAVMGNGTLLVVGNTFASPDPGGETEVANVVFIHPDGTIEEHAGFLDDNGNEYFATMDIIRPDGNPAKIAGDRRPGSTRYAVANESTPYDFDEFSSNDRWQNNLYVEHIFAAQLLNYDNGEITKISNVIDPVYGGQSGLDILGRIRNGGVNFLSNGDLLVSAEDRSGAGVTSRDPLVSILDGETGEIIAGPFRAIDDSAQYSFWESTAAFDGGFAVRIGEASLFTFFDNAGNKTGEWEQINDPDPASDLDNPNLPLDFSDNPEGYTTSITSTGRGDSEDIEGYVGSDFIYYTGRGPDSFTGAGDNFVYVTKINGKTRQSVAEAIVNVDEFNQADRIFCAVDENDNVFVGWSDNTASGTTQLIGRFFNSDLEPETDPFIVFQHGILPDGSSNAPISDVGLIHGSAAMDTNRLVVSARVQNYILPGETQALPANSHLYTVIESPFAGTPVGDWSIY